MTELRSYIRRKLEMARDYPRESRLFANEILQGAPRIMPMLEGELKSLVDEKAELIKGWMRAGKIAQHRPLAPDLRRSGRRRSTMPISTCRCAPCSALTVAAKAASRMRRGFWSSFSSTG